MIQPEVSVIVINYNTFALTKACIDSVIHYTERVSYEIILIENGTGQFSDRNLPWEVSQVRLIVSDENIGFSGANNLGIRHARGTYYLLLNSDVLLKEDSISKCVQYMNGHPKVGALSPRLVYPDGRIQGIAQRFPSVKYGLIELLRLQKLLSKPNAGKLLLGAFFDHRSTVVVDWIWGAFFLIPSKVVKQMPGCQLDNSYFMYWEDVQWCKDIKALGYKVVFYGDTEAVHIHEGSKGNKSAMMLQNERIFMKRNYNGFQRWAIRIINQCLKK